MSAYSHQADQPPAVFRFGEFTFDSRSHLLSRNGVQQHLSPKAQLLLSLLLSAWPNAQSREDIYDAIWPSTFVCETNMAGIVSELRRALGDDARAAHYIRTVHGFGYVFCGEVDKSSARLTFAVASLLCEGQSHQLFEGENWVGRAPGCRVVLQNVSISRHHAVITIQGDTMWLKDLGSKNGTFVDAQKIESVQVTPESLIVFAAVEATILLPNLSRTQSLHDMPNSRRHVDERVTSA